MNEIILKRLHEITPVKLIEDMSLSEIISDCNVAFKIIGYNPNNLEKTVELVYLHYDIPILSDFIYAVWRLD